MSHVFLTQSGVCPHTRRTLKRQRAPRHSANESNGSAIQSNWGTARSMNSSNRGTVKAMSPCAGLQIIPFLMSLDLTGPSPLTVTLSASAHSERFG